MKAALTQLLATAQLAEMAYNADPDNEHKLATWEKAQSEYDTAAEAERAEQGNESPELTDHETTDRANYEQMVERLTHLTLANQALEAEKRALLEESRSLYKETVSLNSQLNEKSQKINELEKSLLSAKSTDLETAPAAVTPETEKKEGTDTEQTDDSKKNS